jgi:hypothetical protein
MDCIDLITPPPSPKDAGPSATLPVRGTKRSVEAAGIIDLLDSDDDDDVQCRPSSVPPAGILSAPRAVESGIRASGCDGQDDGDEELQFLGRKGDCALSDFPHARHNCVNVRFLPGKEREHCPQCYCYVCDTPASSCSQWAAHCVATPADAHWAHKRREAQDTAALEWRRERAAASSGGGGSSSAAASSAGGGSVRPNDGGAWSCEQLLDAITQVCSLLLSSPNLDPLTPKSKPGTPTHPTPRPF